MIITMNVVIIFLSLGSNDAAYSIPLFFRMYMYIDTGWLLTDAGAMLVTNILFWFLKVKRGGVVVIYYYMYEDMMNFDQWLTLFKY